MVSFYSSFLPFPVNIYVFNKRSGSLRASRESINLSTDLSLSLLPQLDLLCTFFESNFLNHFFHYVVPRCLQKKNKTRAKCLVWYSGAQQSFINLLYSAFFTNCYCIWIILPAFPKYDLCFSPSSPWSCYLCFLECLFVQYQLKFTHSPCPPPNPTFLMKTHWPPHLQNYPD